MRASEVLGLDIGDVCLDDGRESLFVREAKNHTQRMVVIGPNATPRTIRGLRAHLRELRESGDPKNAKTLQPFTPLVRSNRGTRLGYDALYYQWQQLCIRAGLVDEAGKARYTIHQLRHTRGTALLEQGQSLETVQRVLGHRDIRSTQGYAEVTDAQVRAALEGKRQR
jgi:integrase/recombinase XerD